MHKLIGRLIAVLAFSGWSGMAPASLLTLEEVGALPSTGVHYFESVGAFDFETIRCNCPTPSNHMGLGLFNSADSPNGFADNLYNTPNNSAYLSHDIDTRMTLSAGGAFDIISMYLGNSNFQSPTLFLKGYLESVLMYDLAISVPNIPASDSVEGLLAFTSIGMSNVDRVEWSTTHINIGVVAMDSISYRAASVPVPVPVPATLALFGLGLTGLGWSRRRKF